MNRKISRRTFLEGAVVGAAATAASLATLDTASAGALQADPAPVSLRFAVYGDSRDGHLAHRNIVGLIVKSDATMVFQTGDLVHNGTNASQWKTFIDITDDLRKKAAYYPARGNHDFGDAGYFKQVTSKITTGTSDYYTVDKGNCHFIMLDVDEHAAYGPTTAQYKWLVKDFEASKGKFTHTFVFFHVPGYSIGSHGMNEEVQNILCPLFIKYGVRIVFTGHDHNYYHTTRQGIPYVVTGGGGAPLYDVFPEKGAIAGDKYEKVNHFCLVDVKGKDVTVQAIRVDGTLMEQFTVRAT